MKEKAILAFSTGELYWEFARFAPHIIWKKRKKYPTNTKFIIMTDESRFDIYGRYTDIFVPFRLKDSHKYKQNCFRLDNLKEDEYMYIISCFQNQFKERFSIVETLFPKINKQQFANKHQFPTSQLNFEYKPRLANKEVVLSNTDPSKKIIILASRFREGFRRNWPYWNDFYDLIYNDKQIMEKYQFIICGKNPDYIPDSKNRFLDINNFEQNINTSLIGITIELLKKSSLTIGSQSAIPNISLLFNVPVLEWGHQKHLHTNIYNIKNTKIQFIEDMKYKIAPTTIFKEMKKCLTQL